MAKKHEKKCEICGKESAEIKVIQFIGGKRIKLYVCKKCSLEVGIREQLRRDEATFATARGLEHACPKCGWRLQDLIDTGLLGCPSCYDEFDAEIKSIMEHFHGAMPDEDIAQEDIKTRIEILESQLRKAIKEERFEDAAHLRDIITKHEHIKELFPG